MPRGPVDAFLLNVAGSSNLIVCWPTVTSDLSGMTELVVSATVQLLGFVEVSIDWRLCTQCIRYEL